MVSGVISGIRKIDGKPLIQLAMPIEQGNSGGPVLDRQGHVLGLVTMKSVVSENLGFAVAVNALKPLLKKPNPVPIDRWLTIGALDETEWASLFGAHWRQRAGRHPGRGNGQRFWRTHASGLEARRACSAFRGCRLGSSSAGGRRGGPGVRFPRFAQPLRLLSEQRTHPAHPFRRSRRLFVARVEGSADCRLQAGRVESPQGARRERKDSRLYQRRAGRGIA